MKRICTKCKQEKLSEDFPDFFYHGVLRKRRVCKKCWTKYNRDRLRGRKQYNNRGGNKEYRGIITHYLIDRDGLNCFYCKNAINLNSYNIAHKVALALGGKSRMENVALSCVGCNSKDAINVIRECIKLRLK